MNVLGTILLGIYILQVITILFFQSASYLGKQYDKGLERSEDNES